MRVAPLGLEIGLGARHEEAAGLVEAVQACKVEIAAIHDVERARLGKQMIEDVDVVPLPVADMDERGDIATEIQQRMQLDGCLGRAKRCPREHRQAQVDGSAVERVDGLFQVHTEGLVDIQSARNTNQALGELGVDAPVPNFVGIGQGAARDPSANAHVIELRDLGAQTGFDVAQALAKRELREGHAQILIETREALDLVLAVVLGDATAKRGQRQMLRELREDKSALVHRRSRWRKSAQGRRYDDPCSNRDQRKP